MSFSRLGFLAPPLLPASNRVFHFRDISGLVTFAFLLTAISRNFLKSTGQGDTPRAVDAVLSSSTKLLPKIAPNIGTHIRTKS